MDSDAFCVGFVLVFLLVLIVLFTGSPDIHDAIIGALSCK